MSSWCSCAEATSLPVFIVALLVMGAGVAGLQAIATGSTSIDACAAAGTARTSPRMTSSLP